MGAGTAFDRIRMANKTLSEVDIFHPDDITHLAWVIAYHATFHPSTLIKDLMMGMQDQVTGPAPGEVVVLTEQTITPETQTVQVEKLQTRNSKSLSDISPAMQKRLLQLCGIIAPGQEKPISAIAKELRLYQATCDYFCSALIKAGFVTRTGSNNKSIKILKDVAGHPYQPARAPAGTITKCPPAYAAGYGFDQNNELANIL